MNAEGNQPLSFHEHHLLCNGQIYNHLSHDVSNHLLRTDVDVILHLFETNEHCIDKVAKVLDGDFACILLDSNGVVHIARDPIGIRPLFYGTDDNGDIICASSEAKAIQPLCSKFYVFPPGHVWDSQSNRIRQYTDLYDSIHKDLTDEKQIIDAIKDKLYQAVKKRIDNTDRSYAFLLSGGIDSSLVLAIAMDILKDPSKIHAFSMQYESRGDDVFYASLLAREYGIKHTIVNFTKDDISKHVKAIAQHIETYDPNTIRASVPMYLLAKHIRETTDYKVFLSGEGADELFMGYNIFYSAPSEENGKLANVETQRLIRNIHMFDGLRADRCFNAHGLEIRFPFLDVDFAKYVFSISGSLKLPRNNVEKALLRNAFNDIPELHKSRIIDRIKERFSDGCGFDYVPQLLRMFTDESDLESRERAEKGKYMEWFEEEYGKQASHLIIERKNPSWCNKTKENIMAF
jgi:asparagine synthase (glutamine-hydrolysing)